MPAGQAWIHAWAQNPELQLYGSDGFHPSQLGSVVAALTIYRVLFNEDVSDMPSRMVPHTPDLPTVDMGDQADLILLAVEAAVASAAVDGTGVVH